MAATSGIMPCSHVINNLESLESLQKVSEEEDVWPDGVQIRPKGWKDLVGVGKGLCGPKGWEGEHRLSHRGGGPAKCLGRPAKCLQGPPSPLRH